MQAGSGWWASMPTLVNEYACPIEPVFMPTGEPVSSVLVSVVAPAPVKPCPQVDERG